MVPQRRSLLKATLLSSLMVLISVGSAQHQNPPQFDIEASGPAAEIIGAPVSNQLDQRLGK